MKNLYKKLFEVKKAGIKLQRDTKAFNYKYATLNQIQEKLSESFEKQGLLIVHNIEDNKVITRIIEIESGEQIQSTIPMSEGIKPQDKGSEITYYRRYNLLSLLDLEVEDDDGAKAQNSKPKAQTQKKWYNDVDTHLEEWRSLIIQKKATPDSIIKQLEDKGFSLSSENLKKIKGLF